ncbi:MAG TPA: DUF222 domain-containing protein, partial [Acidimicrobiales bacterium]|nr:DUF222 domain-containing protein [Acidimicrobiales bacterium]
MKLAVFERALRELQVELSDCEPALIATGDAVRLFDVLNAIERTVVAAKTLVAGRAADSGRWRSEGHRSPASWVAQTTGSGIGDATGLLETAERLVSLPETTEALRRGELSAAQLKEIAATAVENPAAEKELIAAAAHSGLKGLRDECRRVKARAIGEADARERYEQIRKNRSLVTWTDSDGMGRVEARLTPDALGRFVAAIQSEANAIFKEARKSGHHESPMAYAADALLALVTGTSATGTSSGSPSGTGATSKVARPTTMMHLRVDLAALRRGNLEDGEVCEIPGVGPVPLATAVNEVGNSLLKVIIGNAVDVASVCHVGRAIPAHIRSALEDRDESCVVPGCDVARGLENDHYQIGFVQDGPTELWNLCRLCRWHHYLKTHCGYAITGGPGDWEWEAPGSEKNPVL